MSALVPKNFLCGPSCGLYGSSSASVVRSDLALRLRFRLSPAAAVVRELVSGSDDWLGGGLVSWSAREMAGPPVMLGHDLGPDGRAERLVLRHRLARLPVPPGAGRGVGVGQRDGEVRMLARPGVEVGE